MNSPVHLPTKTERLELALRSGTLADVAGILAEMSPGDVAYLISSSPPDYRDLLLGLLEPDQEVLVVNELPDDLRNATLMNREPEALAEIVEQLDEDDVADILHELPDEVTGQVLAILDEQSRQRLQKVLSFPDNVAGGLMSTDVITIRADLTLDVVLRYLRRHSEIPPNTDNLIVVNRNDRFVGLLPLSTVLVSDPAVSVREMMITDQDAINAEVPATEVARRFERNDWVSAPVVDDDGKLLGRITIDDVVDVIREEADHSLTSLARLAEEDTFATAWQSAPRRAVWLGVNLATALLASSVINLFQGTIEKVVALAVLMPIVASMGGIAGTQSLTILIRAMAMGQINDRNQLWLVGRESLVGLLNGALWAMVIAATASLWFNDAVLGIIIGCAMLINLITAGVAGAGLPIVLRRLQVDPALAGGVLVTTITDVIGFLAFLGLATLFYA
ncbi:MAG: magnesium transporter [Proteobacteria bacterium]|nr:magnesium transporter [Luminiphilus sp.]MDA0650938.1 magnesium transporter [Pseudomonadota bacterium]